MTLLMRLLRRMAKAPHQHRTGHDKRGSATGVVKDLFPENYDGEKVIFWDCETTGLNANRARIVSAAFLAKSGRCVSAVGNAEGYILRLIFSVFAGCRDCVFVGYNTEHFDLPFIRERARFLGFSLERSSIPMRRLDLFEIVNKNIGDRKFFSLKEACKEYKANARIRHRGKDVPRLAKEGKWGKILEHNLEDVAATKSLYEALIRAGKI